MNSCVNKTTMALMITFHTSKINFNVYIPLVHATNFQSDLHPGSRGGSFPPVDGVVHKKLLCMPGSMFRIVILHESVPSRINLTNERNQVGF